MRNFYMKSMVDGRKTFIAEVLETKMEYVHKPLPKGERESSKFSLFHPQPSEW